MSSSSQSGAPSRLLGGRTPKEFLDRYWQRRPLLVRGAVSDWSCPVGPNELAGLACEAQFESRLIFEPEGIHPWRLRYGPFETETLSNLPESGWSLLVQAVDFHLPEVATLAERFRFLPNWRIDDVMISHAAAGASVGAHVDRYDVFLVQARGQRQWRISDTAIADPQTIADCDVSVLRNFEADREWTLEAGDLLYLPPGIAHHGIAGEDCITCSVGFRAPTHAELLAGFLTDQLERIDPELRYGDPGMHPAEHPGRIDANSRRAVRSILRDTVADDEAIDRWFGRYVTVPMRVDLEQRALEAEPARSSIRSFLAGRGTLQIDAPHFAFVERTDGTLLLFAGGEEYELAAEIAEFGRLLSSGRQLRPSALSPLAEDSRVVAHLEQLCRRGLIDIVVD